jgi:hypothetical protein
MHEIFSGRRTSEFYATIVQIQEQNMTGVLTKMAGLSLLMSKPCTKILQEEEPRRVYATIVQIQEQNMTGVFTKDRLELTRQTFVPRGAGPPHGRWRSTSYQNTESLPRS